jgi:hypothetical protein
MITGVGPALVLSSATYQSPLGSHWRSKTRKRRTSRPFKRVVHGEMAGWNAAEELKELFRSGDSGLAAFRTKLNSELYTLGFGCQELLHGNYDRRRHNRG